VLADKHEQVFASRYQFELPSVEDLRTEILRKLETLDKPATLENDAKNGGNSEKSA
jgi:hypothetical protein